MKTLEEILYQRLVLRMGARFDNVVQRSSTKKVCVQEKVTNLIMLAVLQLSYLKDISIKVLN